MARGRLWTEEEDHYVGVNRARLRLETIAAELSRSPYAVYQRRYSPTRDEYLTSGLAARETGYALIALMLRRGKFTLPLKEAPHA